MTTFTFGALVLPSVLAMICCLMSAQIPARNLPTISDADKRFVY